MCMPESKICEWYAENGIGKKGNRKREKNVRHFHGNLSTTGASGGAGDDDDGGDGRVAVQRVEINCNDEMNRKII